MTSNTNCCLCKKPVTVGVRGTIEKNYVYFCSFHAGAMQMIFEKVRVSDSVKWKPLFEKPIEE